MPYMDIELIGTASHGKYCTGLMLSGEDTYQHCPEEIKNWGVYVMISIYQNANGETPCMPDGLQPDVTVEDNPMLPYQLGDVNEPLLQAALLRAGRKYENLSTRSHSQLPLYPSLPMPQKATFGKRILPSPTPSGRLYCFRPSVAHKGPMPLTYLVYQYTVFSSYLKN